MIISQHLTKETIRLNLESDTVEGVLGELADALGSADQHLNAEKLRSALIEREELLSTSSGLGLAFPHCYQNVGKPRFALGIHSQGIVSDAPDKLPVRIFLVVISPNEQPEVHLEALSTASRIFIDENTRSLVLAAQTAEEVHDIIARAEASGEAS